MISFIVLLLTLVIILQSLSGGRGFILETPTNHTMLTGDLEVKIISSTGKRLEYYPQSSLIVQLVTADGQPTVVASAPVEEARAVFKCGDVDVAGRYCFQLVQLNKFRNGSDQLLAESPLLHLQWPLLRLEIPATMETYTANFTARLHVQGVVCYPPKSHLKTWLELSYFGASMANGAILTRFLQEVPEFYRVISRDFIVPCGTLDRPGFYQIQIRADKGSPRTLSMSNGLRVTWSEIYDVSLSTSSVFPCPSAGISVFYSHPKCILDRDKIRVFGRPRSTVNAAGAAPPPLYYVGEKLVLSGGGKVDFPCRIFSPRFVAFCFEYVSTAQSGAVANLKMKCIPAYLTPDAAYNGEWGVWSEWTACSSSCGRNSTRNRHRFCDSPPTTQGGVFCLGSAIRVETCELPPCPVPVTTKSPVEMTPVSSRCRCGCKMNISGGAFVAASSHLCEDASVWLLKVQSKHRLQLTFDYLHLGAEDEWVSARDGEFLSSQMLLSVTTTHNNASIPSVKSSLNAVLLEYHPSNRSNGSSGFVLHVQEITGAGLVLPQNFILIESTSSAVFKSTVHWVSLTLCIVALISTLLLAAVYLVRRAKWATTRASSVVSVRSGYHAFPSLTTMTSVSELSLVRRVQRRKKKKRKLHHRSSLSPVSSDDGVNRLTMLTSPGSLGSPEDFMKDAGSMFSASPRKDLSPIKSPPLARRPNRQVALTPHSKRKLPVATVSPQPHPAKSERQDSNQRRKNGGKTSQSASELSLAPTEPEFEMEFDYYDYDVHDVPGSYFSVDPGVLSWLPPFLPQLWSDELMMTDLGNYPAADNENKGDDGGDESGANNKEPAETELCSPVVDLNGIEFADASDSESPKRSVKR